MDQSHHGLTERVIKADVARRQSYEAKKGQTDDDDDRWASKRESKSSSHSTPAKGRRMIKMSRQKLPEDGGYMGKCHRNAVTGEITVKRVNPANDFSIIDLYKRSRIYKSVEDLAADPYLYKPVVLPKRTWIYHDLFRQKKLVQGSDENGMVKYVLSYPVIDARVTCGQYSPLMAYLPMVLFCVVTKESLAVASSLIAVVTIGVVSNWCNHCQHYARGRAYSIPIRVAHVAILVVSMISQTESDMLGMIGYLLCFVTILVDALRGDWPAIFATRFWCHYEIVRELPERLFVCRRIGAAHMEQQFGDAPPIPEEIHGLGVWQQRYILALEFRGVLCKLEPITLKEWNVIYDGFAFSSLTYKYISLGLFDDQTPAMYPYDETLEAMPKNLVSSDKKKQELVDAVGDDEEDHDNEESSSDSEIGSPPAEQAAEQRKMERLKEESVGKLEVIDYN